MSELVKINVNGKDLEAIEGSVLIDTLTDENINIPHFCYHKSLGMDGNCRMCMVGIEGQKRPQIACNTPIKKGMIVNTQSEAIVKVRKDILELELINHPIDCPTCDQAGECKLQEYYMQSGFYESRMNVDNKVNAKKRTDLGANVMLDQERCVLCTRCVRFCSDITKTNELGVVNRGDHSVIDIFPGMPLHNPYAMNVVDLCPVGALTSKDFRFKQRVWFMESFDSICNGCSKACNIHVDHRKEKYKDDIIYRFRPKFKKDVNGYFMCDEGRLSYKNEGENRFEDYLVNKEKSNFKDAILNISKEISSAKKVLFLIGPNLCLEEMTNLKVFAAVVNANISAYSPYYLDETFGDDFLKNSDKSSNRASFKELEISQDEEYFQELYNDADLILNFDNNYFEKNLGAIALKNVISFFSHNNKSIEQSIIAVAIASFYEKSGTYINEDNIKQTVITKIKRDTPLKNISDILNELKNNMQKGNV